MTKLFLANKKFLPNSLEESLFIKSVRQFSVMDFDFKCLNRKCLHDFLVDWGSWIIIALQLMIIIDD